SLCRYADGFVDYFPFSSMESAKHMVDERVTFIGLTYADTDPCELLAFQAVYYRPHTVMGPGTATRPYPYHSQRNINIIINNYYVFQRDFKPVNNSPDAFPAPVHI